MALGYEAIKCVLHIMNVVRFMKVWLDYASFVYKLLNGCTML